jgi:hypothetical protein
LPEREENDEFDGQDLQKRRVLCYIMADLDIKLNQAVHSNRDGNGLNDQGLKAEQLVYYHVASFFFKISCTYPNVRICGTQRRFTISAKRLGDNGNNGHGNANNTILEDRDPNNLTSSMLVTV